MCGIKAVMPLVCDVGSYAMLSDQPGLPRSLVARVSVALVRADACNGVMDDQKRPRGVERKARISNFRGYAKMTGRTDSSFAIARPS